MDFSKQQNKKIYEFILSSTEPSGDLKSAFQSIVRRAIEEGSQFEFLLHRVNWFSEPFSHYLDQLQRAVRLYRGKGKEAAKVAYNLLIQNLSIQQSNKLAVSCLTSLAKDAFHQEIIIQCLKQNYPHKLCPLSMHLAYIESVFIFCKAFPKCRFELLEMIIENLAYFDTQLRIGQSYSYKHFLMDDQIKCLRENANSEIAQKYDTLLKKVFEYLEKEEKNEQLFKQLFQIFQNKILPIKSTKVIQFVVYFLAESDKLMSSKFSSLLLANILDSDIEKQNWYRIFTQSNFYLVSYMVRSNRMSFNKITQIVHILITYLTQKLSALKPKEVDQKLKLKETFFEHQRNLHILQTILTILAYEPEVKAKLQADYLFLLRLAKQTIHFEYFINEELLSNLNIQMNLVNRERNYKIILKYSNKFNPPILPKIGSMIDPIFKWRSINQKIEKYEETRKNIKKCNREESFQNSQTVPSHSEIKNAE